MDNSEVLPQGESSPGGNIGYRDELRRWEQFVCDYGDVGLHMLEKARSVLGRHYGILWFSRKIYEMARDIRDNVPEYGQYAGYHILFGSSPAYDTSPKFDLPAPYSIAKFWGECKGELEKTENSDEEKMQMHKILDSYFLE